MASMALVNGDVRRGKNAFRRVRQAGQFVEELWLIGFDDQKVIGLFVFHDMVGGGGLSIERIGADQGAAQVQSRSRSLRVGISLVLAGSGFDGKELGVVSKPRRA